MNKKLFLLISALILIIATGRIYVKNNSDIKSPSNPISKHPIFDINIPSDANFIDSKDSTNFKYSCKITIDSNTVQEGAVSLRHLLDIRPITQYTYNNVVITAVIDEEVIPYLASAPNVYFGTSKSEKIKIDYKTNPGAVISNSTWVRQDFDKNKLHEVLKKPLKIKLSWEDHVEYVMLSDMIVEFK